MDRHRLVNGTLSFGAFLARQVAVVFVIIAIAIAGVTAAAWVYRACCNLPPVSIAIVDEAGKQYCPGDIVDGHDRITVTAPTLMYLYRSVMNEGENFSYEGSIESFPPRPQPHPTAYDLYLPWTVPKLPPGRYHRVVMVRGHDTNEKPVSDGVLIVIKDPMRCALYAPPY